MKYATRNTRIPLLLVVGLLMLAGTLSNARLALAQSQVACPRPAGGTPVAPPRVTAQQVENGTGSLMDFALSSRDRLREQAGRGTTAGQAQYFACLIRQDGSPWRSGSTYLVTLTYDGRVYVHAKDMSLSGGKLKPSIYRGILRVLGINPADLADPATGRVAFACSRSRERRLFRHTRCPRRFGLRERLYLAQFQDSRGSARRIRSRRNSPGGRTNRLRRPGSDCRGRGGPRDPEGLRHGSGKLFHGACEDRRSGRRLEGQGRHARSQRAVAARFRVPLCLEFELPANPVSRRVPGHIRVTASGAGRP